MHDNSADASTSAAPSSSQQTTPLTPERSAELLIQTLVPGVSELTVSFDEKDIVISGDSPTMCRLVTKLPQVLENASELQKVLQSQLPTRDVSGTEDFILSNMISPKNWLDDKGMIRINRFDLIQFLQGATGRNYLLQGQTDAKGELTARPIFMGPPLGRGREKNITIILDRSRSMKSCYAQVLSALGTIIHKLKERYGQESATLIAFDHDVSKQRLNFADEKQTRACLQELKERGAKGEANLYAALQDGFVSLDPHNKMNVILVISDSRHTNGSLVKAIQAMSRAKTAGMVLQTLFFDVAEEYDYYGALAVTETLGAELIPVARDQVSQLVSHVTPHLDRLFKPMQSFMILENLEGGVSSQPYTRTFFVREGEIQAGEAFSAATLMKVTIDGQQTIIGYQAKASARRTATASSKLSGGTPGSANRYGLTPLPIATSTQSPGSSSSTGVGAKGAPASTVKADEDSLLSGLFPSSAF